MPAEDTCSLIKDVLDEEFVGIKEYEALEGVLLDNEEYDAAETIRTIIDEEKSHWGKLRYIAKMKNCILGD